MKNNKIHSQQTSLFDFEGDHSGTQRPLKKETVTMENAVFDIMDTLTAPILTFSSAWADTIPQRFLDIVTQARLLSSMQKKETATDVECAIYIYTRTLESPMSTDWTAIYIYISCKVLQEWFNEDHWDQFNAPRQLTQWLENKLNDLRRWIYAKRRKLLKVNMRSEKYTPTPENTEPEMKKEKKQADNSTLFDNHADFVNFILQQSKK